MLVLALTVPLPEMKLACDRVYAREQTSSPTELQAALPQPTYAAD
jgi:hypothetical protein